MVTTDEEIGGKCQIGVNTYEEAKLLSESLENCK